ncbi:MAG TPA: hypothetical protein VG164_11920 [Trebonia sp.]|jgi:hypothetical protein|nr:hypothetical protein [Trebonia sp.]
MQATLRLADRALGEGGQQRDRRPQGGQVVLGERGEQRGEGLGFAVGQGLERAAAVLGEQDAGGQPEMAAVTIGIGGGRQTAVADAMTNGAEVAERWA